MALRKHIVLDLTASREAREKAARHWREPLGLPPEQPMKAERRAALREARASRANWQFELWGATSRLVWALVLASVCALASCL